MNKKLSEEVLEKIRTGNVIPRSRLYFILKNIGMWLLAVVSVLVGAFAVSTILFRVVNLPRILPPGLPPPPAHEIVYLIPILWIILFAAFSYFAYRKVRSTKQGYKYELSTLLLGLTLITVVSGIGLYSIGAGVVLDRFAARHLPFQRDIEGIQRERWLNPENGFLIGEAKAVTDSGLVITDPTDAEWSVTFSDTVESSRIEEFAPGERVGLRGKVIDAEARTFLACDARSLEFSGDTRRLPPGPPPFMRGTSSPEFPRPMKTVDCFEAQP